VAVPRAERLRPRTESQKNPGAAPHAVEQLHRLKPDGLSVAPAAAIEPSPRRCDPNEAHPPRPDGPNALLRLEARPARSRRVALQMEARANEPRTATRALERPSDDFRSPARCATRFQADEPRTATRALERQLEDFRSPARCATRFQVHEPLTATRALEKLSDDFRSPAHCATRFQAHEPPIRLGVEHESRASCCSPKHRSGDPRAPPEPGPVAVE
jgi:hypothetical protein